MKSKEKQKIIRTHVSTKLESLRPFLLSTKGVKSWSKYVRNALGMSITQMAQRIGLAQSTMTESEKSEEEGRLTINKLRKMADVLDCDLVYAFIPRVSLKEIVKKQAHKKVQENMKHAKTHMSLEGQDVTIDRKERTSDLIEEKMYSKYLWDE